MSNKATKVSTYKKDQAKKRHEFNREVNEEASKENGRFIAGYDGKNPTLTPLPRGTYATVKGHKEKVEPFTNKGNGNPLRNSQIKRAISRIGKPRKVEN